MLYFILVLLVFILLMAVAFQTSAETWKGAFSNDDGTPSSARVFLALVLIAIVAWSSVIVYGTNAIPQIPSTWENLIYALLVYAFAKKALQTVETFKVPAPIAAVAAPEGGSNAA